ncbi:unnamed protein product [Didymodactylos carnosus]|uniref:Exosome complex component RRP45 n=1 Tax=Didymodactylos carnosus TaxID=1234261 RepID=A0A8S2EZ98_9BILA|nr:unnamed protein product [Didymodactylos carnosus]CAF4163542.1 unnamed protein product [Didymodactylos carnosus]
MNLEQWKHQEFAQEINSILEQNIRHAGCIDLESLCINAGELVWSIKVDIVVLNNCGNILDCASIAALCALYHYRVPEVSVHGSSVRVYGHNERKPRPLRVLHFPLNVMFAFFCDGRFTVIDPSDEEEKVMDGFVAVAMNTHNEICGIKLSGKLGLRKDQIEVCKQIAYSKTAELTDIIRHAVNDYYKKGEAVVNHHLCTDREDENRDSNDEKNEIMTKTNVDEAAISLLLMPAMNRLSVSQDDNSDIDRSISFPEPDLNQLQEEFIEPITPIELTTAEENKSIHVLPNDESWPIAVEIRSNSTRKNECDIVDVVSIIADTLNWIVGEIEASYISNKTGNYIIDHDLTGEILRIVPFYILHLNKSVMDSKDKTIILSGCGGGYGHGGHITSQKKLESSLSALIC